jgi:hypothetical protein
LSQSINWTENRPSGQINHDVRQRIRADPHFVVGIQPQPGCAAWEGAADAEPSCGDAGKAQGARAVCRDTNAAGRVPDGASVVAVSPAEESLVFLTQWVAGRARAVVLVGGRNRIRRQRLGGAPEGEAR